jgi:hypothetical protein
MAMLDFWCYENGKCGKKCVLIKVPDVCCGVPTEIASRFGTIYGDSIAPSYFNSMCATHLYNYELIWQQHINQTRVIQHPNLTQHYTNQAVVQPEHIDHNCVCIKCGDYNEYATPNMPDGKFKCFSCRRH